MYFGFKTLSCVPDVNDMRLFRRPSVINLILFVTEITCCQSILSGFAFNYRNNKNLISVICKKNISNIVFNNLTQGKIGMK